MSERASASFPPTCSGDMYSGVPIITPPPVIPLALTERAIPKSMIRAPPSRSTMMFWGFRVGGAVGAGPGQPQLAPEALDGLLIRSDVGIEELEGEFFPDLGVEDFVDAAHAALAQLFDDLVAAGENRPAGEL